MYNAQHSRAEQSTTAHIDCGYIIEWCGYKVNIKRTVSHFFLYRYPTITQNTQKNTQSNKNDEEKNEQREKKQTSQNAIRLYIHIPKQLTTEF